MSNINPVRPSQIIKCINIARQYPKYYLPLLEQQIYSFQNQYEYRISKEVICQTNEGKAAWFEAKKFLESQKPIVPLIESQSLSKAAQSHALDLQKIDQITHVGSDGSNFVDRIKKLCQKTEGALVEIIGNDFDLIERNHAEMIVLGLIIDDGVTSRGHRNSIFNQNYKYIGCGVGYLSGKIVSVINMSECKLRQRRRQGKSLSSQASLTGSKSHNKHRQMHQPSNNFPNNKNSQLQYSVSSSISSSKSHKSQKLWTFTNMQERSRKGVNNRMQKDNPHIDLSSKLTFSRNQYGPQSQFKENIPSQNSISSSQSQRNKNKCSNKQDNIKNSRSSSENERQNASFNGQNIVNSRSIDPSKSSFSNSTMKSQGSSGFRKIKQKKQMSRVWQEGEFKFEQKVTAIKYTDGTQQEYKEKKSVLLQEQSTC